LLVGAARWIDRRDAEILLAHCWGLTRSQLFARQGDSVPGDVADCFSKAVTRRSEGVPVAYLLRRREFWSLTFEVSPAVLVPRPETELLVQRVPGPSPSRWRMNVRPGRSPAPTCPWRRWKWRGAMTRP
jgi:methylase of polypeptide subunit release factors